MKSKKHLKDALQKLSVQNQINIKDALKASIFILQYIINQQVNTVINIKNFGLFKKVICKSKIGRNLKTGEKIQIPKKTLFKCKISTNFKKV